MRHKNNVIKLSRTRSHRKALFVNLAVALIDKESIITTQEKAKAAKSFVERLITIAVKRLKAKDESEDVKKINDLNAKRKVARYIRNKKLLEKLFTQIAPRYVNRPGGYTRIIKLGRRKTDSSEMVILELVEEILK